MLDILPHEALPLSALPTTAGMLAVLTVVVTATLSALVAKVLVMLVMMALMVMMAVPMVLTDSLIASVPVAVDFFQQGQQPLLFLLGQDGKHLLMPPFALLQRVLRLSQTGLSERNISGAAVLLAGGPLYQSGAFQLGNDLAGGAGLNTQPCGQLPLGNGPGFTEHDENPLLAAPPFIEGAHRAADIQ